MDRVLLFAEPLECYTINRVGKLPMLWYNTKSIKKEILTSKIYKNDLKT